MADIQIAQDPAPPGWTGNEYPTEPILPASVPPPPPRTPEQQSLRDVLAGMKPAGNIKDPSTWPQLFRGAGGGIGNRPLPLNPLAALFGIQPARYQTPAGQPTQQPGQPPAQQPTTAYDPTTGQPTTAPVGTAPIGDPTGPKDVKLDPEHPDTGDQKQVEQRYLHTTKRPHQEWGHTPWAVLASKNNPDISKTSYMPSYGPEAVRVVGNGAKQLAGWGFPATQQYWGFVGWAANVIRPFMDFYSGGAFGRSYDATTAKGLAFQREAMEINHQRMLDAGQYAIAQDNQKLAQYSEIVAAWQSHAYSKNDDQNTAMAQEQMKQLAVGDPLLQSAIDNGGLKGGMNLISDRHRNLVDSWLGLTSLENAPSRSRAGKTVKDDSELDRALGAGSVGGDTTTGGLPGPPLAGGAETPDTSGQDQEDQGVLDQSLMSKYRDLGPTGIAGAHELLQTGKFQGMNPTGLRLAASKRGPEMLAASEDLRAAVTKEANSKDNTEDKIKKIKAIDSQYGNNVERMSTYQIDPKDDKNLAKIAASVNPDYKEGNYKAVQEFYSPNKPYSRMIERQDAFPGAGVTLLKAIHDAKIPEDRNIVLNYIDEQGTIRVTGDPRYSNIIQSIQSYVNEYAGILSAQGTPRIAVLKDLQQVFKAQMSPAQLRNAVQIDTQNANRLTDAMKLQWQAASGSKSDPPGWNPKNDAITQGIIHMNADRGTFPMGPETPNELKAISNPENTPRPPWMSDRQAAPPLTAQQRSQAEEWLKNHSPDTPGWNEINQSLGINR